MSTDVYAYCIVCRINHTQKRKHIFSNKHKQRLKTILQKYGQKIKECRVYLNDPVIQDGNFEADSKFWCHCCQNSFQKHVSDFLKTILYGGVIEHLASEMHWLNTETFWREQGADQKFKSSFIVSQTDISLFKSKLEPLVDIFDSRKEKRTKELAKQIESQEISRKLILNTAINANSYRVGECSRQNLHANVIYKTVKNQHGVLQNPSGYHNNIRVWKGGIVKYGSNSDQLRPFSHSMGKSGSSRKPSATASMKRTHTVAVEAIGLTSVSVKFDSTKGNIHTGAVPPWLLQDVEIPSSSSYRNTSKVETSCTLSAQEKTYGPTEDDLKRHMKAKAVGKLNPNRVGANFDHSVSKFKDESNWLPSFGRVWNNGARWKSRKQYRGEVENNSMEKKKPKHH